jgi:enoyl-CoA hydratase
MKDVDFSIADGVAILKLNRPAKLNSVTPEMAEEIGEHSRRISRDPDIRVGILTGSGLKAFCVGSDIAELDSYPSPWAFRTRPDYCDAVRQISKPMICAVNGYALGGGLEMAMSCDIRLASKSARFGAPEIKLGWIGGGGMTTWLVHNIGVGNAARMIYTGDPIDAELALRWGLVSELFDETKLMDGALELASVIAQRAPIAAQTAKLNLRAALSMPLDQSVQYERDLQTVCMGTQDATEGREAFKAKRAARFRGH